MTWKKSVDKMLMEGLAYMFVAGVLFVSLGPFLYVILTSLKSMNQIYNVEEIFPSHITWQNYYHVIFKSRFTQYFCNSIFVSVTTTFLCMVLALMAAYGLTRYNILGANKIKMGILMTRMFPAILLCIPFYTIMKQIKLIDSYVGLIAMYCSFVLPFAIWNACAFYLSIPWDLEESARIDGCSRFQAYYKIIFPLLRPGVFVTALFCFMSSWDEYMYSSVFITTNGKKTIQVGMQDFVGQYQVDWGLLMAAVVISLIPIMVFFAVVQKNLVNGLSAGAVKG